MEILKKLIQINSVTGNEKEIQEYILNLLASFGLKTFEVKGNVVVAIKGVYASKCLILNSHIDTVSPGDHNLWVTSPFGAVEKMDKIYGLGASDNKASVATLLLLAKELAVQKPDCDVILTFTIGEEVDGHGTNDVVNWLSTKHLKQYKNISAIVCEPTGLKEIGVAHKGNMFFSITTTGKSGHGSSPIRSADHSVIKMYKIIASLEKLGKKWSKKYKNKILGVPTIGLATSVVAGSATTPNKFPDTCQASFDIRTIPEMYSYVFAQVKKAVGKLGEVQYLYPPVAFAYTSVNEQIVSIFKKESGAQVVAFSGSSDMPFFTEMGIPTIIFGPGEANMMHKPNEYCYKHKVEKCILIFKKVIKEFARI